MCIAILKPEGITLFEDTLKKCWESNSDGAGFMYAEKGKLHIKKGFFTFDEFMENYEEHATKQAVLHFRIRTHGNIDEENCHPYPVDNNLAFVHNGTISSVTTEDATKSDTWHFNEQILKPIRKRYKAFFKDNLYTNLIDSYIGWSKLIFLNSHGEYSIVNEKAGEWNSGCWFSNSSWKTFKSVPVVTYSKPSVCPTQYDMDYDDDEKTWAYRNQVRHSTTDRSIISTGDICWVTSDFSGLRTGDYVKVKYVYADDTIGCLNCKGDATYEYRVPPYVITKTSLPDLKELYSDVGQPEVKHVFEKEEIVTFKKNWNHFRKDTEVVVIEMSLNDAGSVIVEDSETFKRYIVPCEVLEYTGHFANDLNYGVPF